MTFFTKTISALDKLMLPPVVLQLQEDEANADLLRQSSERIRHTQRALRKGDLVFDYTVEEIDEAA